MPVDQRKPYPKGKHPFMSEREHRMWLALRQIAAWDMLNPPDVTKLADAKWLKDLVDAALR